MSSQSTKLQDANLKKFAELSTQDGMYNIIIISQTTPHKLSPLQIIWLLNLI